MKTPAITTLLISGSILASNMVQVIHLINNKKFRCSRYAWFAINSSSN